MNSLSRFRRAKDDFYRNGPQSPIPDRTTFAGLDYYAEAPDLRFQADLTPADGSSIAVQTSDGQERLYTREAEVKLQVADTEVTLVLYGTGHGAGYFLPFRDATSGTETYGAGRYLDIDAPAHGTVTIDFNLAYNPYCAYNDAYSCPLPPAENWLQVPIRAGEKSYSVA